MGILAAANGAAAARSGPFDAARPCRTRHSARAGGSGQKIAKTTPCKVEWTPACSGLAPLRLGHEVIPPLGGPVPKCCGAAKIQECTDLCSRTASAGLQGIEREALVGPIGEELDQDAAGHKIARSERHDLGDACAGHTSAQHRVDVGDEQGPRSLDRQDLVTSAELPFERAASHRITEIDAVVGRKVCGMGGPSAPLQIGRRCHRQDAGLCKLAGDEGAGGRRVTEPDSEIKPFGDQVADCVAGHQLQSQLRIVLQERRQMSTRREKKGSTFTRRRPRTTSIEPDASLAASSISPSSGVTLS
jgi:hypothetical protein